jgi:hypothetical protein
LSFAASGALFAGCHLILGIEEFETSGSGGGMSASSGGGSGGVLDGGGDEDAGGVCEGAGKTGCEACLADCTKVIPVTGLEPYDWWESGMMTTSGKSFIDSDKCPAKGPEHVYRVEIPDRWILNARILNTASFDTVLYARQDCCSSSTKYCADRADAGHTLTGGEVLSFPVKKDEIWYIFVDSYDANEFGTYELQVRLDYGGNCNRPIPIHIEAGSDMTIDGEAYEPGEIDNLGGSCKPEFLGAEAIYNVTAGAGVTGLDITMFGTGEDSMLYAKNACSGGTELACDDTVGTGEVISLSAAQLPAFVFADFANGKFGPFKLTFAPK